MKLDVFNIQGEKTGRAVDLPDDVFGGEPNEHVLYLAVKQYLANQRQGTHKSKERWEISGSTRKLHRQKGTGGSRKGDINSPLFPGGARVFGPRPRDYEQKLNKKVKRLAHDSPRLIAVYRVLLRLLAPRHPPYALSSLTTTFVLPKWLITFVRLVCLSCACYVLTD